MVSSVWFNSFDHLIYESAVKEDCFQIKEKKLHVYFYLIFNALAMTIQLIYVFIRKT